MQNTYQDLITDLEGKKPEISGKLEGGKKFKIVSDFKPAGDQPAAIKKLVDGANKQQFNQVLLGVTGSGKTFTMAKIIETTNRPALILAPNKTLAAQLYGEFKQLFPENAVEYFISYYDYYQPEAYIPTTGTYIEKDLSINEEIENVIKNTTNSLWKAVPLLAEDLENAFYNYYNKNDYLFISIYLSIIVFLNLISSKSSMLIVG